MQNVELIKYKMLCTGISGHANVLVELLEADLSPEARSEHLNAVKMSVYLLCQFMDMIESVASKPSEVISGKVYF